MKRTMIGSIVLAAALALTGCSSNGDDPTGTGDEVGPDDTAGAGGGVEFGGIADGDTVSSPVPVTFETTGEFEIIPAADGGGDGSGHVHVMVDVGCVAVGETIPNDETHLHFGDGSTSADLELEPGEHTLCLQAGDGEHTAMDVTDEITITVE